MTARLVGLGVLAASLSLAIPAGAASGEIRFKHHYIGRDGPEGEIFSNLMLGDLDKDGRTDVVVGRSRYGAGPKRLYWYRNLGRIDAWSDPLVLNAQTWCNCGGVVLDVDRDGWPDVVDGGWYRNPGRQAAGAEFVKKGGFLGGHDTEAADLDGDDDADIVTRPYKPHQNANGGRMHVSVLEDLARKPDATGPGSGVGPGTTGTLTVRPARPKPSPAPKVTARKPTKAKMAQSAGDGLVAHWTFDELDGKVATFDRARGHVNAGKLDVSGSAITLAGRFKVASFTGRSQDGRTMRLYKDGTEVGSMPKTGAMAVDASVPAWIGDNPPEDGSRPFLRLVDDVRIYRRALTAAEVAALAKQR